MILKRADISDIRCVRPVKPPKTYRKFMLVHFRYCYWEGIGRKFVDDIVWYGVERQFVRIEATAMMSLCGVHSP